MGTEVLLMVAIETEMCCNCGVPFGMERGYRRTKLNEKTIYYCPNGHGQHYIGKRIEEELADTQARLRDVRAERDRLSEDNMNLAKKNRTFRLKAKAGMCAFCHRSFQNVKRHMDTQHSKR